MSAISRSELTTKRNAYWETYVHSVRSAKCMALESTVILPDRAANYAAVERADHTAVGHPYHAAHRKSFLAANRIAQCAAQRSSIQLALLQTLSFPFYSAQLFAQQWPVEPSVRSALRESIDTTERCT